jgi:hypothetical protein
VAPSVGPVTLPGVLPVALLWGRYMAVSACAFAATFPFRSSSRVLCVFALLTTDPPVSVCLPRHAAVRYQLVGAAENAAERSPLMGRSPGALAAVSTAVRLCNNVYGAGLFVEMMKDSGISP